MASSTNHNSSPTHTNARAKRSSWPERRELSVTSESSGASNLARSAAGNEMSPATGNAEMGAASPNTAWGATTISRHASAVITPALYARGRIHATVLGGYSDLIWRHNSKVANKSPPGVSSCNTIASAPALLAFSKRFARPDTVSESISP